MWKDYPAVLEHTGEKFRPALGDMLNSEAFHMFCNYRPKYLYSQYMYPCGNMAYLWRITNTA